MCPLFHHWVVDYCSNARWLCEYLCCVVLAFVPSVLRRWLRVSSQYWGRESPNPQKWENYFYFWECGNGPWTLKGQSCRVCFIWWSHEGQETHITISLNVYISQLSGVSSSFFTRSFAVVLGLICTFRTKVRSSLGDRTHLLPERYDGCVVP